MKTVIKALSIVILISSLFITYNSFAGELSYQRTGFRSTGFGNGYYINETFIPGHWQRDYKIVDGKYVSRNTKTWVDGKWAQTGGNVTWEQIKQIPVIPSNVPYRAMPQDRSIHAVRGSNFYIGSEVMRYFYMILAIENQQERMDKYLEFLNQQSLPIQRYFIQNTSGYTSPTNEKTTNIPAYKVDTVRGSNTPADQLTNTVIKELNNAKEAVLKMNGYQKSQQKLDILNQKLSFLNELKTITPQELNAKEDELFKQYQKNPEDELIQWELDLIARLESTQPQYK